MKKQMFLLYVLLILILIVLCGSVYSLLTMDTEPEVSLQYQDYQEIQETVTVNKKPVTFPSVLDGTAPTEEVAVYIDFDLAALRKANDAFDSWLMIPDTDISFPVVMPEDNSYYLYRNFKKQSNAFGCLFFDVVSQPGSHNRVIYGHNMGNGRTEMFSPLVSFQEQAYAEAHTYAYLATSPEVAAEVYELFAVVNFDLSRLTELDFSQPIFTNGEEQADFVRYLQDISVYETDFVPKGKLLILVTCNRNQYGSNNRLLICYGIRNIA